jgi:hypothetical protein
MANQDPNSRRTMPMVNFAQHRLNPGAGTIAKSDVASQPFQVQPPAFMVFNQQRTAAHAAAKRTAAAVAMRKRQVSLAEALAAIDAVLHPNTMRKVDGFKPTVGLGALLQARAAAKKQGLK